jgi:hypothetical protein
MSSSLFMIATNSARECWQESRNAPGFVPKISEVKRPANHRVKQSARPVTPLALVVGGPGTDPGCARVAPGHAAA